MHRLQCEKQYLQRFRSKHFPNVGKFFVIFVKCHPANQT